MDKGAIMPIFWSFSTKCRIFRQKNKNVLIVTLRAEPAAYNLSPMCNISCAQLSPFKSFISGNEFIELTPILKR